MDILSKSFDQSTGSTTVVANIKAYHVDMQAAKVEIILDDDMDSKVIDSVIRIDTQYSNSLYDHLLKHKVLVDRIIQHLGKAYPRVPITIKRTVIGDYGIYFNYRKVASIQRAGFGITNSKILTVNGVLSSYIGVLRIRPIAIPGIAKMLHWPLLYSFKSANDKDWSKVCHTGS